MRLGRRVLIGAFGLTVAAASLASTDASAGRGAFESLACSLAHGNLTPIPGPGPHFGYGAPSCEPYLVVEQRRKARVVRRVSVTISK